MVSSIPTNTNNFQTHLFDSDENWAATITPGQSASGQVF